MNETQGQKLVHRDLTPVISLTADARLYSLQASKIKHSVKWCHSQGIGSEPESSLRLSCARWHRIAWHPVASGSVRVSTMCPHLGKYSQYRSVAIVDRCAMRSMKLQYVLCGALSRRQRVSHPKLRHSWHDRRHAVGRKSWRREDSLSLVVSTGS